jgi:V8-like Glu-specific endopeptidase
VRIEATFPLDTAGHFEEGTGAMVDRFHVLTAGHLIYNNALGGWATKIAVFAGQQDSLQPFGVAYSTNARTTPAYINDSGSSGAEHAPGDGDIGLITLDRDLGTQAGWMGFGYNNDDAFFSNANFNKTGYPGSAGYDGQQMYTELGPLSGPIPGVVPSFGVLKWSTSYLSAIPGESGSPLYVWDAGTRTATIYGVEELESHDGTTGYAERINSNVVQLLDSWINQDHDPAAGNPPPVIPPPPATPPSEQPPPTPVVVHPLVPVSRRRSAAHNPIVPTQGHHHRGHGHGHRLGHGHHTAL